MSIEGKKITRDGVTLNVLDLGEGPVVMLVHGNPDSNYVWRHQIPELVKAGYRVIAPDMRGFGLSDAPVGVEHYHPTETAADFAAILDELGITEKVALFGHDMGAMACWATVDAMPERFSCFMPMSVGAPQAYFNCKDIRQKEMAWYVLLWQTPELPEQMFMAEDWYWFRNWLHHHPLTDHAIEDFSREGRFTASINWYRAAFPWMMAGAQAISKVPTTGVWSDGDNYLVESQLTDSEAACQSEWNYIRVDNASHWFMLDRPEHATALMLDHLNKYHPAKLELKS